MAADPGPKPASPQVLCIGLPPNAVEQITRVIGTEVLLTEVADVDVALETLALTQKPPAAHGAPTIGMKALVGNIRLDRGGRRAFVGVRDLKLSPREFDLTALLHDHPGHAWTYEELSSRVWGQPYLGDPDTIATAVRRLRKRLGVLASVEITAIRGFGYRLDILDSLDQVMS